MLHDYTGADADADADADCFRIISTSRRPSVPVLIHLIKPSLAPSPLDTPLHTSKISRFSLLPA